MPNEFWDAVRVQVDKQVGSMCQNGTVRGVMRYDTPFSPSSFGRAEERLFTPQGDRVGPAHPERTVLVDTTGEAGSEMNSAHDHTVNCRE